MSKDTSYTGIFGENAAMEYARSRGYAILGRNVRSGKYEIDIIGRAIDGTLVFFEVKTIVSLNADMQQGIMPEEHMDYRKIDKIKKICQKIAHEGTYAIDENVGWRIDLITVLIKKENRDKLTEKSKNILIKHYENVIG